MWTFHAVTRVNTSRSICHETRQSSIGCSSQTVRLKDKGPWMHQTGAREGIGRSLNSCNTSQKVLQGFHWQVQRAVGKTEQLTKMQVLTRSERIWKKRSIALLPNISNLSWFHHGGRPNNLDQPTTFRRFPTISLESQTTPTTTHWCTCLTNALVLKHWPYSFILDSLLESAPSSSMDLSTCHLPQQCHKH